MPNILERFGRFDPPARGEAASFDVTAEVLWTGAGISRSRLHRRLEQYRPLAKRRLERMLRTNARRHRPHEAAQLEADMCEGLRAPIEFDSQVSCTVDVRVEVGDEVRQKLAEGLDRVLGVVNDEDYGHRKADSVTGLHNRWRQILKDMDRTIEDRYGAHLVEDPEAYARAVEELLAEGRKSFENLEQAFDRAVGNFQRIGLYEYATGYETALEGMQHYFGVDVPSKQNGSSLS